MKTVLQNELHYLRHEFAGKMANINLSDEQHKYLKTFFESYLSTFEKNMVMFIDSKEAKQSQVSRAQIIVLLAKTWPKLDKDLQAMLLQVSGNTNVIGSSNSGQVLMEWLMATKSERYPLFVEVLQEVSKQIEVQDKESTAKCQLCNTGTISKEDSIGLCDDCLTTFLEKFREIDAKLQKKAEAIPCARCDSQALIAINDEPFCDHHYSLRLNELVGDFIAKQKREKWERDNGRQPEKKEEAAKKCEAVNLKSGRQCTKKAIPGTDLCGTHTPQKEPWVPPRCEIAVGDNLLNLTQCSSSAVTTEGEIGVCWKHYDEITRLHMQKRLQGGGNDRDPLTTLSQVKRFDPRALKSHPISENSPEYYCQAKVFADSKQTCDVKATHQTGYGALLCQYHADKSVYGIDRDAEKIPYVKEKPANAIPIKRGTFCDEIVDSECRACTNQVVEGSSKCSQHMPK